MSRMDYVELAKNLNIFWLELEKDSKVDGDFAEMVNSICYDLESGNPRFDKKRFIQAVTKED